ncbi:MAG: hypothetical protein SF123_10875, partial [Chloroflexota bacterium]|nr:hypothetical protein [Chloroflexota bacterium]
MNYADAKALADCVVNLLAPHCQRIDIAGSIRRKMSDIGDIDIVCEPGDGFDAYLDSLVPEVLALDMSAKTGKPTANGLRQKSFRVGDTKIELWIVRPDR